MFEPRVFVIEQRSGGNPPGDKLTIRFAPRHLSACIEQFSAFETGINSFAVRDTDTLKNRRRLVISRLWRESLLDRAKTPSHPVDRRRYRPIPARRTGPARHPPRQIPAAHVREGWPLPTRQITVALSFCRTPLRREQRQRCSRFLFRFRLFWFLSFPV